jgi:hypothetical protein
MMAMTTKSSTKVKPDLERFDINNPLQKNENNKNHFINSKAGNAVDLFSTVAFKPDVSGSAYFWGKIG